MRPIEYPDLAARRTRKELAQTHNIRISVFVEPAAPHDELVAEIPDVSDRPAEAGDPELQESREDFPHRARACARRMLAAVMTARFFHRYFTRRHGGRSWPKRTSSSLCGARRVLRIEEHRSALGVRLGLHQGDVEHRAAVQ
jgi:hypothetical protein